jgi:hypothetical protein
VRNGMLSAISTTGLPVGQQAYQSNSCFVGLVLRRFPPRSKS